MSAPPDISVVMGVYNGGSRLRETMDSVLGQRGVSLEFIIVDDGSTDETAQILHDYAQRDCRVKAINQPNEGLTSALIKGCAAAKGLYIARQDAGDVSLPNRLQKQLRFIKRFPDAALASCGTKFVGPGGEYLFEVKRNPDSATESLRTLSLEMIQGPSSHPSTIFSRDLYEQVGGYRPAFYFAQDLDLWIRMAERGPHVVMPDILYQASLTVTSISGKYRAQQIATARLILESASLRRKKLQDAGVLKKASGITPNATGRVGRAGQAQAMYFIGMCLRQSQNPNSSQYFRQALLTYPLHVKSAVRLLLG